MLFYIFVTLAAFTIIGRLICTPEKKSWRNVFANMSFVVYIGYIPYFLSVFIHDVSYNFDTTFQTLKYLLDNQGMGS